MIRTPDLDSSLESSENSLSNCDKFSECTIFVWLKIANNCHDQRKKTVILTVFHRIKSHCIKHESWSNGRHFDTTYRFVAGVSTNVWHREDGQLPDTFRASINKGHLLHISSVSPSDEGVYICEARNSVGAVSSSVSLSVHGKRINLVVHFCSEIV